MSDIMTNRYVKITWQLRVVVFSYQYFRDHNSSFETGIS